MKTWEQEAQLVEEDWRPGIEVFEAKRANTTARRRANSSRTVEAAPQGGSAAKAKHSRLLEELENCFYYYEASWPHMGGGRVFTELDGWCWLTGQSQVL